MSQTKQRNLVICRAGDHSFHPQWIQGAGKQFDLWVDYYGEEQPETFRSSCDWYHESPGLKFPGLYKLIKEFADQVFQYDAVWLADDDIETNTETINQMFAIFHRYDLWLAQPSLSRDSFYSHSITLNQPDLELRFTNWVEVMVPIFAKEALQICWATFQQSQSGWGLDNVWAQLFNFRTDKIAIIDAVTVKHTRPVGTGEAYQKLTVSPRKEMRRLNEKYHFPNQHLVYGSIKKE